MFSSRFFLLPSFLVLLLILFGSGFATAQPANIRINSPGEQAEEVTIAINPTNPMNIVGGANINFYYYSHDGGATWFEGALNSQYGVWGDPALLFDPYGSIYFGHLSYPSPPGYWIDRIVVQKSTDGGGTWSDGSAVGFNPQKQQDKEWLAFDPGSPLYRNNLYMSWTEFDRYGSKAPGDSSRILFSRSSDMGASWSAPITISDRAGDCIDSDSTMEGAVPAVGPEGEVYVAWAGDGEIIFDRSLDGGATFGPDRVVASQPGGWDFDVPGLSRSNGLPVTMCDLSNSPHRGTLYILWSDQRNGRENTDVFLIRSTDRGDTWGTPVRVNDDQSERHQFFPAMSIDPVNGDLYVAFYDRRRTADSATEVYLARSADGGATFTNMLVSQTPFTPYPDNFLGDYIGVAAYGGWVHPIWTRIDGADKGVWTASIRDSAVADVEGAHRDYAFGLIDNAPSSPGAGPERIYFSLPEPMPVRLVVYNYLGEKVAEIASGEYSAGVHGVQWDLTDRDGNPVSSGLYIISMETPRGLFVRKVVEKKL
jgi:hypothetical protein